MRRKKTLSVIGWREWVALPLLGEMLLRCKVDTGARTSALHAFYVEEFQDNGVTMVRFGLHPEQDNTEKEVHCVAEVADRRTVTDSGGHQESRYVIKTTAVVGNDAWPIEITLTNRDSMRYRMLLGRSAIASGYLVDAARSHLMGQPTVNPVTHEFKPPMADEEE